MSTTVVYAFLAIAAAPFVGIWRGHRWAKKQGLTLRKSETAEQPVA